MLVAQETDVLLMLQAKRESLFKSGAKGKRLLGRARAPEQAESKHASPWLCQISRILRGRHQIPFSLWRAWRRRASSVSPANIRVGESTAGVQDSVFSKQT